MTDKPVVIVGGGPAGLIAAAAAAEQGANVILIDREKHAGGILNQCIHTGFGLAVYKEELTGPEFAERAAATALEKGVTFMSETSVLSVSGKTVSVINEHGVSDIDAGAVVLCTGCRERPRGALHIPGTRPAGVYTAGLAQKLVNIAGFLPGKRIVILGSGDIGLIMARRLTLEGAEVLAVVEVMPAPGGLRRNIVQCLDDFGIPLYLSHTVTDIRGKNRVEGVTIAKVDEKFNPVEGTSFDLDCDTLLLSVGLIPENEIAETAGAEIDPASNGMLVDENLMTTVDGVFGCGNALHVHNLVDDLAVEAAQAGKNAALYAAGHVFAPCTIPVVNDGAFGNVVPARVSGTQPAVIRFRVRRPQKGAAVSVGTFSKRFAHLQPNTMESVTVPADAFTDKKEAVLCLNNTL